MRVPDNLDLFEMYEREQVRMSRRRKRTERIDEAVDKEVEEKVAEIKQHIKEVTEYMDKHNIK